MASHRIVSQVDLFESIRVRSIETHGSAEVQLVPSRVTVVLVCKAKDKSHDKAVKLVEQMSDALMQVVQKHGVPLQNVQTGQVVNETTSYWLSRSMVVIARRYTLRLTGPVLEHYDAFMKEITRIPGVKMEGGEKFETEELFRYRTMARNMCIANARARAESLIVGMGMRLGLPICIAEGDTPMFGSNAGQYQGGGGLSLNYPAQQQYMQAQANVCLSTSSVAGAGPMEDEDEASSHPRETPTYSLGTITVNAQCSVVFELIPLADPAVTELPPLPPPATVPGMTVVAQ